MEGNYPIFSFNFSTSAHKDLSHSENQSPIIKS